MANPYDIASELEEKLRREIKKCVYCGKKFGKRPKRRASWEHIVNRLWRSKKLSIQKANVVLCCCSCNSSKGRKELGEWLEEKGIARSRITNKQVRAYLKKQVKRSKRKS